MADNGRSWWLRILVGKARGNLLTPTAPTMISHHLDNSCQTAHDSVMSTGTMNIALPDVLRAFVAQRVESGEYGNTSEYVRDLIRKDQREQRVQRLRALVEDGLASGPATADTRDDWVELRAIADGRGQ
jgi:antitoxin ParD1/3/4